MKWDQKVEGSTDLDEGFHDAVVVLYLHIQKLIVFAHLHKWSAPAAKKTFAQTKAQKILW